jgi:hypothetical protein
MAYDGTNLTMILTDGVTGASFYSKWTVDIPSIVGGPERVRWIYCRYRRSKRQPEDHDLDLCKYRVSSKRGHPGTVARHGSIYAPAVHHHHGFDTEFSDLLHDRWHYAYGVLDSLHGADYSERTNHHKCNRGCARTSEQCCRERFLCDGVRLIFRASAHQYRFHRVEYDTHGGNGKSRPRAGIQLE